MMVSNGPEAIDSAENHVEVLAADGELLDTISGGKEEVARRIIDRIERHLIQPREGRQR
jgi:phosphopantothenoylcysteine decarboxylase/phosphopantothenate--cysteine ligase